MSALGWFFTGIAVGFSLTVLWSLAAIASHTDDERDREMDR